MDIFEMEEMGGMGDDRNIIQSNVTECLTMPYAIYCKRGTKKET